MELTVHPELKQPLTQLCNDPKTTVIVLSGSGREVLDEVILEFSVLYFLLCELLDPLLTYCYYRTLKNMTYGWQRRMECF